MPLTARWTLTRGLLLAAAAVAQEAGEHHYIDESGEMASASFSPKAECFALRPSSLRREYPCAPAHNTGFVNDQKVVGVLELSSPLDACTKILPPRSVVVESEGENPDPNILPQTEPVVALIERGGCAFGDKVRTN
jgi:hypothetical protein